MKRASVAPGGRDKRPGLNALLKGVGRSEFDIVAAWSVCAALGRSLSDLSVCCVVAQPNHRLFTVLQ